MAPKKDKKGGKDKKEEDAGAPKPCTFTEVDKTFLDLQLAESNRKVGRLRTAVDEYEIRNEELQKAYDKLDEDRADIIAYLKKTLNLKNEENTELKDKVKALEELREIETTQFKERVAELEKNFTTMKDQLTSENKLLAGKLNTLEEFRAIRDDLMNKFEKQEQAFKDQEMKYKRIIYDAEKKFVIGKDKLKKDMEARLLQLAQDFQDATELRIAASTHRVIRENIAINNELDSILSTQAKLSEQNEVYKERERSAHVAREMAEEERDTAINKNVVQLKVIDQLTAAFQDIKKDKALFEKKTYDSEILQMKIQKLTKENDQLSLQVRILEQNVHSKLSDQNKSAAEIAKIVKECEKLKRVLKEAAIAVRAALKLDKWVLEDPTRDVLDRQSLLCSLLEIVSQFQDLQRTESVDTLGSIGRVYDEGDLGFVPRIPTKKSLTKVTASPDQLSKAPSITTSQKSKTLTPSTPSMVSLKTIPSMDLIPASSQMVLEKKESLASFVTSTKSTVSESIVVEEEEEMDDVAKALAASKAEIQKAIAADMQYSQLAMQSQLKFAAEHNQKMRESQALLLEELRGEEVAGEEHERPETIKEGEQTEDEGDTVQEPKEEDTEERED